MFEYVNICSVCYMFLEKKKKKKGMFKMNFKQRDTKLLKRFVAGFICRQPWTGHYFYQYSSYHCQK